jgi:hypothetical protein
VTPPPPPAAAARRRWLLAAAVVGGAFLVPAVLVPAALYLFREPAFGSIDELTPDRVAAVELFVLNRPDRGPDVGSTKALYVVPDADRERVLAVFRGATPTADGRTVFLGRMVVRLTDGRREQIILDRVPGPTPKAGDRLRFFVGRHGFDAGPVDAFTKLLDEVRGEPGA